MLRGERDAVAPDHELGPRRDHAGVGVRDQQERPSTRRASCRRSPTRGRRPISLNRCPRRALSPSAARLFASQAHAPSVVGTGEDAAHQVDDIGLPATSNSVRPITHATYRNPPRPRTTVRHRPTVRADRRAHQRFRGRTPEGVPRALPCNNDSPQSAVAPLQVRGPHLAPAQFLRSLSRLARLSGARIRPRPVVPSQLAGSPQTRSRIRRPEAPGASSICPHIDYETRRCSTPLVQVGTLRRQ